MQAPKFWQHKGIIAHLLWPLSWLYQMAARRVMHKKLAAIKCLPVPVIVVGNINVGGTGKTPVTIALIAALQKKGYCVGLISRGYGRTSEGCIVADATSSPKVLGDEPYLIREKTGVAVAVCADRHQAGIALLNAAPDIDVIISDDGLQHYALARDFEIAVIGEQGVGNGYVMPAGPLREPVSRLASVSAIVSKVPCDDLTPYIDRCYDLKQTLGLPYPLHQPTITTNWCNLTHASAVAGIAHPDNFFRALKAQGVHITPYPFDDHHAFCEQDFAKISDPIVMTEKDAVKCTHILKDRAVFVVPLETTLPDALITNITHCIQKKVDAISLKERRLNV